jgi:hypothetical protein
MLETEETVEHPFITTEIVFPTTGISRKSTILDGEETQKKCTDGEDTRTFIRNTGGASRKIENFALMVKTLGPSLEFIV